MLAPLGDGLNTSVVSVVEPRNRVPVTTIAQTANIVDVPSDNDQRRLLGQITTAPAYIVWASSGRG